MGKHCDWASASMAIGIGSECVSVSEIPASTVRALDACRMAAAPGCGCGSTLEGAAKEPKELRRPWLQSASELPLPLQLLLRIPLTRVGWRGGCFLDFRRQFVDL